MVVVRLVVLLVMLTRFGFALKPMRSGGYWNNDVYCGRHFDDYVTQTVVYSAMVIRPAILVMYTPDCADKLLTDIQEHDLPPDNVMVIATHDHVTCPKYIWYEIDARDDLQVRYNPQQCPEYIYFANGSSLEAPTDRYNPSSEVLLKHWVWIKLLVRFTIYNTRPEEIYVLFSGPGPMQNKYPIKPGEAFTYSAYLSQTLTIRNVNNVVLYARVLDNTIINEYITIDPNLQTVDSDNIKKLEKEQADQAQYWHTWRWNVASTYLTTFKQPIMLHKFTEKGYLIRKMPGDLHERLLKEYHEKIPNRQPETLEIEPAINDREVKCGFVKLSPETQERVANEIKVLAEEFGNVTLKLSYVYGVREYYTGNILRNHVDVVFTHVIGAILQIEKDLGDQPDWELEIIDFEGKRKQIFLESGDIMLYESSTLIHGRPYPYKGKVFANMFLHYKPVSGWDWEMSSDGYTYINREFREPLSDFVSPTTYMKRIRDEL